MRSERLAGVLALLASTAALATDVWEQPFPGVRHLHRTGPANVDVHAAVIDLCAPGVSVRHTGFEERGQRTSVFAQSVGAQLAINADFFCRPQDVGPGSPFAPCVGHPVYATYGLAAHDGEAWPGSVGIDALLAFGADRAEIFDRDLDHQALEPWMREAVGGHWSLVRDGVQLPYDCPIAPQTGVGLSEDHRSLVVAVADGRNGWRGMTCLELGALLQELGAFRAFALDSGGSSTFWMQGRGVLNHPSDGSERVVASHLAVFAGGRGRPPFCEEPPATVSPGARTPPVTLAGPPGRFTPLSPVRLFDTRNATGSLSGLQRDGDGRVAAGSPFTALGLAAAGVGMQASGVAINLTVAGATGAGYASVWASGPGAPPTSTVNFTPEVAASNLALTGLGAGGSLAVSLSAPAHAIADLQGFFAPTGAGFVPERPTRLLDTRGGLGVLRAGVPVVIAGPQPPGTRALALSVTATDAAGAGYVTVFPCGEAVPGTSTVNFAAGQTAAAAALAKIDAHGVCAVASVDTHLVVDRLGEFTDVGGLALQPVIPTRLLDSRLPGGAWSGRTGRDQSLRLPLTSLPAGTRAVAINLTATEALDDGYASVFPCDPGWPGTSNLNFVSGQTVASAALVDIGAGALCLRSNARTHVVIDLTGVFIGPELAGSATQLDGDALTARPLTTAHTEPARQAPACSLSLGGPTLLALLGLMRRARRRR